MEIKDLKQFDIGNTIDADELSKRWGVSKKTIDNRRSKKMGPGYWKITGTILYDLRRRVLHFQQCLVNTHYYHPLPQTNGLSALVCLS